MRTAVTLAALVVASACSPAVRANATPDTNDAETAIPVIMNAMAHAWNNADLPRTSAPTPTPRRS